MGRKAKKTKKKKLNWRQWIAVVFFMLIGAVCGFLMMEYVEAGNGTARPFWQEILSLAFLFAAMYFVMFVQIIVHESGHLVFGLLSGYQFSSFRIMSFMWIKEDGKLRMKRFSLAGTGGQCLMNPPDLVDGKIPVVLYNLGGSLMNLIVSLICLIFYFIIGKGNIVSTILLMMVFIGVAFAMMNGIPMRMGAVDNDGYNALSISKNPDAVYAFWMQMKVNAQISKGIRLKDMPEEWFEVPTDELMKNSMIAVRGVFVCNRLMDEKRFAEADELMEHFLSLDSGIVGLHRDLMVCDRIYCELLHANREEVLKEWMTKDFKKFMKSMKTFPSVIRTQYTYTLLAEKDEKKAAMIKEQFDKMAKNYPYPNDIESEQELMKMAARAAEKMQEKGAE